MKSRDYWQQRMVAVKEAAEQRYENFERLPLHWKKRWRGGINALPPTIS